MSNDPLYFVLQPDGLLAAYYDVVVLRIDLIERGSAGVKVYKLTRGELGKLQYREIPLATLKEAA